MKNKNILVALGGLLAAATTFFLVRKKSGNKSEKPPRKAPQLHLENPGSQDNFPSSAVESEVG